MSAEINQTRYPHVGTVTALRLDEIAQRAMLGYPVNSRSLAQEDVRFLLSVCGVCLDYGARNPHFISCAYRDAEGWVLFNSDGDPVDWPPSWPDEIDGDFLEARGVRIAV